MSPGSSNQTFRKILFWITTTFLVVHISLSSICIFSNAQFLPNELISIYNKLVVLGPFFIDKRITISPHLYISNFSRAQGWSPFRDIGKENFSNFQHHPWKYTKLKWSNYERYIALKAYPEIHSLSHIDGSEGKAANALLKYASMIKQPQTDSIRLVYVWNNWQSESQGVKNDTIFNVIFKPQKGEVPQ